MIAILCYAYSVIQEVMNETSAEVKTKRNQCRHTSWSQELIRVIRNQLLVRVCSSLGVKEKRKPVPSPRLATLRGLKLLSPIHDSLSTTSVNPKKACMASRNIVIKTIR